MNQVTYNVELGDVAALIQQRVQHKVQQALQDHQPEVDALKARNKELEANNEALTGAVAELTARNEQLKRKYGYFLEAVQKTRDESTSGTFKEVWFELLHQFIHFCLFYPLHCFFYL